MYLLVYHCDTTLLITNVLNSIDQGHGGLVLVAQQSLLCSLTEEWLSAFEDGQEVPGVFIDYCKAFDSVPHLPLVKRRTFFSMSTYCTQSVGN